MQFFKIRENASGESRNESGRLLRDHGPIGGDYSQRQWLAIFLAVLLAHGALLAALRRPPETETPAEPLVMAVEMLTAPAPAKPAPPAPPVAQPKPQPKPAKPKKAPAPPKKPPVVKKPAPSPVSAAPQEPAPAAQAAPKAAPVSASAASPAPPVAAASAATAAPKAAAFTEANYRANYQSNPKPEYPRLAKSRGWQGKVLLRVEVTADGRSAAVAVQQSSGHKQLDDAAAEAVRRWTFIPAKRGNTPVASTVTVPIQFKLND
jgi:protein TonB